MEDLEKVHEDKKQEVFLSQDLAGQREHRGPRERGDLGAFWIRPLHQRFPLLVLSRAVEAGVGHASRRNHRYQHREGLEVGKALHVGRDQATEQDAGRPNQAGHLAVLNQLEAALVAGGDFGEKGALRQQDEREQAVEGAQGHNQMQPTEPVAFLVLFPRKPREEEGQGVQGSAVQNRKLTAGAAGDLRVVLEVPKEGVIDGIPDHENHLGANGTGQLFPSKQDWTFTKSKGCPIQVILALTTRSDFIYLLCHFVSDDFNLKKKVFRL